MNDKKKGGPAFPGTAPVSNEGMTLRDYFAGQALAGVASNPESGCNSPRDLAYWAYQCADAGRFENPCQPTVIGSAC